MQKLFRLLALATLAIASTTAAFGADHSLGTWKVNVEKSTYNPGTFPIKSLTSVREAADGGVKVTSTGERADGTAVNATYTAKYDGSPSSVSGEGSPYDTVSIKQTDANTFTWDAKKSTGQYHAHGRIVVSSDGKTMTMRATGTDANGRPMAVTLVYDKQ
ncbi:MAG: hypothetical protein WB561_00385 [Terracidiphilus sp.]